MSKTGRVAVMLGVALMAGPCMAENLFNGAVFPTGVGNRFATAVDVNADGHEDVITSGFSDFFASVPKISVLLGDGEGGFAPQIPTTVAVPDPYQVATGDFNGDSLLDVVVTNFGVELSGAQVLLGHGDGGFTPGQLILLADVAISVAVADFDGDDTPDLALGRPFNLDIVLYFGAGDGTFAFGGSVSPGRVPTTLAVEDLNADGRADLVVGEGFPSALAVHLGDGDGTFQTGGRWEIGQGFGTIALGDLNGDGTTDAAVADNLSNDVSAFLGIADGTFFPSGRFPVGTSPISLVMVDFNGDQRADIVTANADFPGGSTGSNDLSILAGNGDGTFDAEVRYNIPLPRCIASGDFDGDLDHDLAIGIEFHDTVVVFNDGSGRLLRDAFLPVVPDPGHLATGDLNNDGKLDLVVSSPPFFFGPSKVAVFLGSGDGTFSEVQTLSVNVPLSAHVVDLDLDSKPDIVVHDLENVAVFMGNGDGTFAPGARFAVGEVLATGDLNDDGRVDLIATWSSPARIDVRLGNGDGTFGAPRTFAIEPDLTPLAMAISDLNEDGKQDLAVGTASPSPLSDQGAVSVLFGVGDGTFGPSRSLGDLHPVQDLVVVDFDADGNRDIAVLTISRMGDDARQLEGLTMFFGEGDGEFARGERLFDDRLLAIAVGDIDGDAHEDLVTTKVVDPFAGEFVVLREGSRSTIANPPRFLARDLVPGGGTGRPLRLQHVLVADFDNDSRPDVGYSGGGGVTVMLNEGPFPNEPPVAVAAAEARVECTSPAGGQVMLDGSGSSDPDSSPGTLDDIVAFEWFEDIGLASEQSLGSGQILPVTLSLGDHAIALRVTDSAGETAVDQITVSVVDTTPPVVEASVSPQLLWPPNHRMVPVEATVMAADACSQATVALESVTSDEEDDALGPEDGRTRGDMQGAQVATADAALELRAERDGLGDGRVYTLTYVGTDESGNLARAMTLVVVPHDQSGVTDPVEVTAREGPAGTLLEWSGVAGAFYYNVVRGHVGRIRPGADAIGLGDLACVESRSLDASSAGHEDAQRPPPGEAYFYLVEYNDGWGSSFGSEGLGLPRVKQGGGCP